MDAAGQQSNKNQYFKQQDGKDITVHGSAKLVQTLMQHDLVDLYQLLVYPMVVGKGKRLFEEGVPATLKLLESRSFSSGVVALVYEPDRHASPPYPDRTV